MARNFLAIPFAAYQGVFSSKPFTDGVAPNGQAITRLTVVADIPWYQYNIAGQSLGSANPNFNVIVDLNAAASNTVSLSWKVNSVYIDNDACNFPVYVYFPNTGYSVSCPPNSAGWFKVFTNDRRAYVVALGITNNDINALADTKVFFTDAVNVPFIDPENPSAVQMRLTSPVLNFGTTGGTLTGAPIVNPGSGYTGAGLSVSGGGGVGGALSATVDSFGRFTTTTVAVSGSGYVGPPAVAPTAAQGLIPTWSNVVTYNAGDVVSYVGLYWQSLDHNISRPPDVNQGVHWTYTGVQANVPAVFAPTVSPIIGGNSIVNSSNYGAAPAGDQTTAFFNSLAANTIGVFKDNLFGTPFNSGFIYITHAYIENITTSTGTALWVFEDTSGDVLWSFQSSGAANNVVMNLQGAAIKLPATSQWRLRLTQAPTNAFNLSHMFAWTYSQF